MRPVAAHVTTLLGALLIPACTADQPRNPSFPISLEQAEQALDLMEREPKPLARPVVVLSGIFDPGWGCEKLARRLKQITSSDDQVISVCFIGARTFDACAQRVIEAVDHAFPSNDPTQTVEIDVVACSMGGLVARHAASLEVEAALSHKRLRVARLFTISTPHRGAKLATKHPFDDRINSMRVDSEFVIRLNQSTPPHEIVPYVRLKDYVVGEENAAPHGCTPWWVANQPLTDAHMGADNDVRILADISRQLRNEPRFTAEPPSPIPQKQLGQFNGLE